MGKKILFLIVLLALVLRLNNLNWDQGYHLHPDERFLTMVGNAMKIEGLKNYFNPAKSLLNPANIGFKFYVYGAFPIILNKLIAVFLGNDNYNFFTIQGRALSAIFDVLTLIVIYKIVELLEKKFKINRSIKYWSIFLYALAVLPIQLSHFFAVDTFLTFFMLISFYFVLRYHFSHKISDLVISGVYLAVALGCKISAIYIIPLELFFLIAVFFKNKNNTVGKIISLIFYGLIIYFVLRVAAPYYFEKTNFLNPLPNKLFIANLKSLESFNDKNSFYPPGIQWISKSFPFGLINLAFFGIGLPYFFFLLVGFIVLIYSLILKKDKNRIFLSIPIWIVGFFIYQSLQYVKAMRYFIFLYPFFAIISAFGINWFLSRVKSQWLSAISLILLLIWPLAFSSIYLTKNSRIQASEWIYENIPGEAVLLNEHWDDPLPLLLENNYGKNFKGEMLPVFYPDTDEKWQEMNLLLSRGDYYILSSNRAWGSISSVSDKYPKMSRFYSDLFADKLNYKKVAEFTSYPNLCSMFNIPCFINDSWSDESFTVYDHPKVMIFKHEKK